MKAFTMGISRCLQGLAARWGLGPVLVSILVAGAAAQAQAPRLVSTQPVNIATGVAVTAKTVVFVFDVAMLPNTELNGVPNLFPGAMKWTGVDADNFNYDWSADGKTLTCEYSENFPGNTKISWQLNPSDASDFLLLTSASGVPLPKATYSGAFTTGAGSGGGGGGGETGGVPKLASTTPANNATAVPVSTTVQFVFDQPMTKIPQVGGIPPFAKGAITWSGTGLAAAKFSYAWSADGTVLTCDYQGDLPATTKISWVLNEADALIKLVSESGDELPSGQYAGSFTTGAGGTDPGPDDCNSSGIPDTWGGYNVNKSGQFVQASSADPVPISSEPFIFGSFISPPAAGPAITSASLTLPNGTKQNHQTVPFVGFYMLSGAYNTEAALEAAYPAGAYTLRFQQSGQAERAIPMTIPAAWPSVPKILNFTEAQAVNAGQAFTLQWNAFTGGAAPNDFISLTISSGTNIVFSAPDPCVPRDLAVTATSIVIPAGTFVSNVVYTASLNFARQFYVSTNAVPNMGGFGSISRSTEFTIKTTGPLSNVTAAKFVAYRVLPNGNPELTITGTAGRAYSIERAGNLGSPVWRAVGTATPNAGGTAVFEDAQAGTARPIFYRAVAN
ncbi:MAG: Ig-like domain-containing protein [Verrucomicrobiales bacterium]|nr:Ig-like domain-containing protein [Verrucomicrobiales bacterium]